MNNLQGLHAPIFFEGISCSQEVHKYIFFYFFCNRVSIFDCIGFQTYTISHVKIG